MGTLVEIRDICKVCNPGENEVKTLDYVSLTIGEGEAGDIGGDGEAAHPYALFLGKDLGGGSRNGYRFFICKYDRI